VLGDPRKGVLGIKVLLRAGVGRPREKLARSITRLAPAFTLTTLASALFFSLASRPPETTVGEIESGLMEKTPNGINVTEALTSGPKDQTNRIHKRAARGLVYGNNTREMDTRHGTLGGRACI
jgi:hypothetical protein